MIRVGIGAHGAGASLGARAVELLGRSGDAAVGVRVGGGLITWAVRRAARLPSVRSHGLASSGQRLGVSFAEYPACDGDRPRPRPRVLSRHRGGAACANGKDCGTNGKRLWCLP